MHAVAPNVVRHEVLLAVTVAVGRTPPRHRAATAACRRRWPRCADELRCSGPGSTPPGLQVPAVLSAADVIVASGSGRTRSAGSSSPGCAIRSLRRRGRRRRTFGPMTRHRGVDRGAGRPVGASDLVVRPLAPPGGRRRRLVGRADRRDGLHPHGDGGVRADPAVARRTGPWTGSWSAGGEHRVAPSPRVPGDRQGPQGARRGRSPRGGAELRVRRDVLRRARHAHRARRRRRWSRRPRSSSRSPPRRASSCSSCGTARRRLGRVAAAGPFGRPPERGRHDQHARRPPTPRGRRPGH